MLKTASTAPAAPNVCPVKLLVEEKGGTELPNRRIIARLSTSSLFSVPVPWALMYPIREGASPAEDKAADIAK